MKRVVLTGQIITLILFLARGFFISPATATTPLVVINELMWMGSSASSADEWIELRNLSAQTINLSGWRLTKLSNGQETAMLTIPEGKTIEPDGLFLISNYSADVPQSTLSVQPDLIDTAVSLVNTGLQIKLYTQTDELIDVADDGSGKPLAGEYVSGSSWSSMERNDEPADGVLAESWHTSTISQNFDADAPEFGTPKAQNSVANRPPVAEAGENQTALVGENVYFDATGSSDPDGDTLTFLWDFGDGSESGSATPTHVYTEPGDYRVRVTVSDGFLEASDELNVTVEDVPAEPEPPAEPIEDIEYSDDIIINELLPNPEGADAEGEFIELKNNGAEDVLLTDWVVKDASRSFSLAETTTIKAGNYLALLRSVTGLALNNTSAETVQLIQPDGTLLDEVSYQPPVSEGFSLNRTKNQWRWSATSTPGAENVITDPVVSNPPAVPAPEQPESPGAPEQPVYELSDEILITELLPNPTGEEAEEEFIELANFGSKEISLIGWQLTDQKTFFQIESAVVLEPGEFKALLRTETKIALNNPADTIYLVDPENRIKHGVSYTKAAAGLSWSRQDNTQTWAWTEVVTPNEPNELIAPENELEEKQNNATTGKNSVSLTGIITAPPNLLGSRICYVVSGGKGVQVTLPTSGFPSLELGDTVFFTGNWKDGADQAFRVGAKDTIKIVSHGQPPEPIELDSPDQLDGLFGNLVKVAGTIVSKSGQTITLRWQDQELPVFLKRTAKLSSKELIDGQTIAVTGLLDRSEGYTRILPRYQTDIVPVEVLGAETGSTSVKESTPLKIAATDDRNIIVFGLVSLALAGGAIALVKYLRFRKRKAQI